MIYLIIDVQNGRSVHVAQTIKKAGFHWMIAKVTTTSCRHFGLRADLHNDKSNMVYSNASINLSQTARTPNCNPQSHQVYLRLVH